MLKEEFFPLMGEIKGYISTLTFAGKGIFMDHVIKHQISFKGDLALKNHFCKYFCLLELLESDHLHSVIRLVLKTGNYMNAVSIQYKICEMFHV